MVLAIMLDCFRFISMDTHKDEKSGRRGKMLQRKEEDKNRGAKKNERDTRTFS